MRIGITGASGLIGTALRARLTEDGHQVVPFVRRPAQAGEVHWDPAKGELDGAALRSPPMTIETSDTGSPSAG